MGKVARNKARTGKLPGQRMERAVRKARPASAGKVALPKAAAARAKRGVVMSGADAKAAAAVAVLKKGGSSRSVYSASFHPVATEPLEVDRWGTTKAERQRLAIAQKGLGEIGGRTVVGARIAPVVSDPFIGGQLGSVRFTEIANRQISGVRFGVLPQVVWPDAGPGIGPFLTGGEGGRVGD